MAVILLSEKAQVLSTFDLSIGFSALSQYKQALY